MAVTITATGPTVLRTFAFPDANATILTSNAAVTAAQGGTGITAYTVGDILYASGAAALSALADVATGSVLVSGGITTAPAWSASPTLTKVLVGNGTTAAPSLAFASEPGTGFLWRSAGSLGVSASGVRVFEFASGTMRAGSAGVFSFASAADPGGAGADTGLSRSAAGVVGVGTGSAGSVAGALAFLSVTNAAGTIGANLKVDALPTVASGFGTSPSVTAGSTPFAGSVNVGTGGVATSGVINFNGTAFPSSPFVVCMNTTTGAVVRATATTTQLTITAPSAFVASDVIAWICVSSK